MSQYVTKIKTVEGDKQIDYNALANLPTPPSITKNIEVSKEGWYRIATSAVSIYNCLGTFRINGWRSSAHTSAIITAGTNYGQHASSKISVVHCGLFGNGSITKARLVYHSTYSGNYAYLELYVIASTDRITKVNVEMSNEFGWTMIDIVEGSVPSGYTSKEVVLTDKVWSDVTATSAELNYMDGVTSNVQTQLNEKFNTSGGTITGNVIINSGATSAIGLMAPNNSDDEQAYARIYKNASATSDYGLQLRDYTHGDVTANDSCALVISNNKTDITNKLVFTEQNNGVTDTYKIYGEHNKPTLSTLGVTATAAELNYVDGVTSNIQTQLNGKAASSHGTHVTFATTAPKVAGTAAVGSATTVSRSDHVHPAQTTVSGNAGTATKLATARTIRTNLGSTSTASFDGSANVTPGVTGTLPVANGGTGATSAVSARENLGIYVYTGYITTSSSTEANGLLSVYLSAKTIFGFSTVPSNFMVVSATSRSTYFSCNIAHEKGADSINVKMRNVSGTSVGTTNYYYTIIGMLV